MKIASVHPETANQDTGYVAERKQNPYACGIRKSAEAVMCQHFQLVENESEVKPRFTVASPETDKDVCFWTITS